MQVVSPQEPVILMTLMNLLQTEPLRMYWERKLGLKAGKEEEMRVEPLSHLIMDQTQQATCLIQNWYIDGLPGQSWQFGLSHPQT